MPRKTTGKIGLGLAVAAVAATLVWQGRDAGRGTRDVGRGTRDVGRPEIAVVVDPPDPGISDRERDCVEAMVIRRTDGSLCPAVAHGRGLTARLVAGANPSSMWLDGNVSQRGKALIVVYTSDWNVFLPVRRPYRSWKTFDEPALRAAFAKGPEKVQAALEAELAQPKPNPAKVAALRAKLARFQEKKEKFEAATKKEEKWAAMRHGLIEATKERVWVPQETCFVEFAKVAKERCGVEWSPPKVGK